MKWKVISYSSLMISILSLGLAIKNMFFWDGVTTFIEKTTGLAEPFGTLLLLLLFVLGGRFISTLDEQSRSKKSQLVR